MPVTSPPHRYPSRLGAALVVLLAFAAGVLVGQADPGQPPQTTASVPKSVSRSGIPYRSDADAGPAAVVDAIRARRPDHRLLNLDRMLLHSPRFAEGWNTMFGAIRGQLSLPSKLRELAIMSVAVLNRADYEWVQHRKEFLAAGGTVGQLDALRDPRGALADSKRFDDLERGTLALTYEMTRDVAVRATTMRRVRALLPDQQVVELVGTIAGYNMVSRFLVATGVEVE